MLFLIALIFLFSCLSAETANILLMPGHVGASHYKSMAPLAEKLAQNGHVVIMFQLPVHQTQVAKLSSKSKIQDRTIIIPPAGPIEEDKGFRLPADITWQNPNIGGFSDFFLWYIATAPGKKLLDTEKLRQRYFEIINEKTWDILIVDDIFTPMGMLAVQEAKK